MSAGMKEGDAATYSLQCSRSFFWLRLWSAIL